MKVLVTGGAGYLGSVLVRHLAVGVGANVVVYDNLLYDDEYRYSHPRVEFVYGDVTDTDMLKHYARDVDAVVWLAAIVGDAPCMVDPVRSIAVNRDAVKDFLKFYNHNPLIFASSCSVYGISDGIADESSPTRPVSLYAETKLDAEKILLGEHKNSLILRFGTLHGLSSRMRYDLVVNAMTRDAVWHKRINVFGGKQSRPMVSVGDVSRIIGICLYPEYWEPGIYNVSSENVTIGYIADLVRFYVDGSEIVENDSHCEDRRNYTVSSEKLTSTLERHGCVAFSGYRDIIDGSILEIEKHLKSNVVKNPYAKTYHNAMALKGG